MPAANRHAYTREVIKVLSHAEQATFLNGIPDKSQYVTGDDEAQVIHMTYLGVKPDVLINNTTYPLAIQEIGDEDIPIALDKFQTKATPITDDELYAATYDRMKAVIETHTVSINETKFDKAIHAFCPAGVTASTPILKTTGADDGTGRKRLTRKDVIALKAEYDKLKVPSSGRRLVLCPEHVNDLLQEDQKFTDQYYNYATGSIARMYSFEIYEYVNNPHIHKTTLVKLSFGGVVTSNHKQASVSFYAPRMVKASGKTLTYLSAAKNDPLYQRNLANVRNYFIALPMRNELIGAIISDDAV